MQVQSFPKINYDCRIIEDAMLWRVGRLTSLAVPTRFQRLSATVNGGSSISYLVEWNNTQSDYPKHALLSISFKRRWHETRTPWRWC